VRNAGLRSADSGNIGFQDTGLGKARLGNAGLRDANWGTHGRGMQIKSAASKIARLRDAVKRYRCLSASEALGNPDKRRLNPALGIILAV
jgi:hypothetical protein